MSMKDRTISSSPVSPSTAPPIAHTTLAAAAAAVAAAASSATSRRAGTRPRLCKTKTASEVQKKEPPARSTNLRLRAHCFTHRTKSRAHTLELNARAKRASMLPVLASPSCKATSCMTTLVLPAKSPANRRSGPAKPGGWERVTKCEVEVVNTKARRSFAFCAASRPTSDSSWPWYTRAMSSTASSRQVSCTKEPNSTRCQPCGNSPWATCRRAASNFLHLDLNSGGGNGGASIL
mmetsp:Transcript_11596/g.41374  ORF Transcript_11596/g.41374 Transcript_11596/m.41374 type:complete len:235 (+) Transcript_11596:1504-2208(+)